MQMNEIDFVIAWVDGSDEKWQKKKNEFVEDPDHDEYYRDWGLLPYLFRSIEKYAPWVHHVYLVTDEQIPHWLNTDHPKVTVVDHKDFIPLEYLPTFNSHTIELNVYRIKGLAEQFVYFNDDFLLTKHCNKSDFFIKGQPVDEGTLNGINGKDEVFAGIQFSNMSLMNRHYSSKDCRKNLLKWITPRYGRNVIRTLLLLPFQRLQGIYNPHGPMPILKKTCELLWKRDFNILDYTCRCRERRNDNVSVYVYRYEQLLSGNFVPRRSVNGYYDVREPVHRIAQGMKVNKTICINDMPMGTKIFQQKKSEIQKMMERRFSQKSSYEK